MARADRTARASDGAFDVAKRGIDPFEFGLIGASAPRQKQQAMSRRFSGALLELIGGLRGISSNSVQVTPLIACASRSCWN
jgi:hypothetical protein